MNIGFLICACTAVVFGILGLIFAVLKGKAAILISGFNTMPKAKRSLYNRAQMSRDMRNSLFLWMLIMIIGAIGSFFISSYMAVVAFIIWLVFFFKEVHVDEEKAFGKYKKG